MTRTNARLPKLRAHAISQRWISGHYAIRISSQGNPTMEYKYVVEDSIAC